MKTISKQAIVWLLVTLFFSTSVMAASLAINRDNSVISSTPFFSSSIEGSLSDQQISNVLSASFTVFPTPLIEEIDVPIETRESGGDGEEILVTPVRRITELDGRIRDEVNYNLERVERTIEIVKEKREDIARVRVPDLEDKISEVLISIPKDGIAALAVDNIHLELETINGRVHIPAASLQQIDDDIYFRFVPIKDKETHLQMEEAIKQEETVRNVIDEHSVQIVGRPLTLETNLQSREVKVILPVPTESIPRGREREAFLRNLAIFIEHSDGEKVLKNVEVIPYRHGEADAAVSFTVTKFSTFTILHIEGLNELPVINEPSFTESKKYRTGYIHGFPDRTFRAETSVTRAQLVTMLARLLSYEDSKQVQRAPFSDVQANYWGAAAIEFVKEAAIIQGFTDGTFRPDIPVTRAQMTAIIARYQSLVVAESQSSTPPFTDISGHWAEKEIIANHKAGIVNGYVDGSFRPNDFLTRAEAVTLLNKAFARGPLYGVTAATWSDVSVSHWAFKDIESASKNHYYVLDHSGIEWFVIE